MKLLKEGFNDKKAFNSLLADWHAISNRFKSIINAAQIPNEIKRIIIKKLYSEDRKIMTSADDYNEKVVNIYLLEKNIYRISDEMEVTIGNLVSDFPDYKSVLVSLSNKAWDMGKQYWRPIGNEIINTLLSKSVNKNKYSKLHYIKF
mgnify:CR=1 FL=1